MVDVVFGGRLPAIGNLLRIGDAETGLAVEAVELLGGGLLRTIALQSTDGLSRGTAVFDTGRPITTPVGPSTLGRVFNVLGEPVDGRAT